MDESSFGPTADPRRRARGVCWYCWDNDAHRKGGTSFGGRYRRIGPVCKHRLAEFRKVIPVSKMRLWGTRK